MSLSCAHYCNVDALRLDGFQEAQEKNADLLKFPEQLECLKEAVE